MGDFEVSVEVISLNPERTLPFWRTSSETGARKFENSLGLWKREIEGSCFTDDLKVRYLPFALR